MSTEPGTRDPQWDVVLRPHRTAYLAYGIAAVIAIAGIVVGVLSKVAGTGAYYRPADQVSLAGLALIIAAAVLLLTRPRLRVGAAGVAVRNLLGYRLIPWNEVVDVSFPKGARWARVDIAHYEYVPVLAIQSFDRERAVAAMETVRTLMARYRPDITQP